MRTIFLLIFINFFAFNFISNAQNGGASQPFTSLGQAQNVTADGVYYFSLSGTTFSTYVLSGGWVQVAIDFGNGVGNLPQVTALTNTARGILSPAVLNKLGGANTVKITSNALNFNITSTNATHVTRVVNNQCLHTGTNDNGLQGSWSGSTSSLGSSCNSNSDNSLHQRIYHAACSGNGFHWIPKDNNQSINLSLGELPASSYLQLWVKAPMVAVINGPVINTQPSTSAQSVCLNAAINALSVSATSPNGSGITYQWYSNASASNAGGTSIGSATGSSYTPPNNVVGTVYYYVICTNNQGSTKSNVSAGVTVNAIPTFSSTTGASICGTGTATLQAATAAGTINWYTTLTGGTSSGTGTSFTTPSISTTTTYYANVTNNGCTSSPRTAVVATVITGSTASSSQSVCPGLLPSAITLTNYSGTIQWQTSANNSTFTDISGQTTATLAASAIGVMSATKYIRAMVTNGTCVLPSNVVTLSPTSVSVVSALTTTSYVWNGQSSSDWGTLSNWYSYNGSSLVPAAALPSNAHTVVIPANSTCILNQPSISTGAIIINNLVAETGSQLTQSGGSLLLMGNYSINGTLNSTGGLTNFYGPSSATISGSGSIQFAKMLVNKLSGASITLQRPVTVTDSLTMVLGNINTTTTNILTLGISSSSPGKLVYTNGTIVGPFKRFFTNAATIGTGGRFPVGTAAYNRYAEINFGTTPGTDQSLIVEYISGSPMQGGAALYNGLPMMASGALIQNYSDDGYWSIIPTDNNYTAPINLVNYSLTLNANTLTGMQTPQICRIIKSPGSNTANQHHIAWQSCGTHTTIPGTATPTSFLITSTAAQGFSWFNIGSSNNQALPVELLSFTGNCSKGTTDITWETASEHNSLNYELEKSRDGQVWSLVATIAAAGNSTQLLQYHFEDGEALEGDNYYRLIQNDIDGASEIYDIINVSCSNSGNHYISAYPNPSSGDFQIVINNNEFLGASILKVMDTKGSVIHQRTIDVKEGQNLIKIQDLDLSSGIYYLSLSNGDKLIEVIKLSIR